MAPVIEAIVISALTPSGLSPPAGADPVRDGTMKSHVVPQELGSWSGHGEVAMCARRRRACRLYKCET